MNIALTKIDKNYFLAWLGAAFLLEILSFLTFVNSGLINYFSGLLIIVFLVISLKDLRLGIIAIFAELILGVYGYLFVFEFSEVVIPIRFIFFIVWLSVWVVNVLFRQRDLLVKCFKKYWRLIIGIVFIILLGVVSGILYKNTFANVFFDVNGWFYWVYFLPFMMYTIPWKRIWPLVLALISWIALKTIVLEYLFSHKFENVQWWLYHWLRDFRLAEITPIISSLNRVFAQNQLFLILLLVILLFYFIYTKFSKINYLHIILIIILLSATFISYSRSFWLGILVAGIIWLTIYFIKKYSNYFPFRWKNITFYPVVFVFLSLVLVLVSVNFPYPDRIKTNFNSLFSARFGQGLEEPAANARLNMLKPLYDNIKTNWFLGKGFGTTITFNSTDPRIVASSPGQSGEVTTYAFEWGYFDIWLKVGLLGLVIYLYILIKIFHHLLKLAIDQNSIFLAGLSVSLLSLYILNITTPYLNHPLGIGFIILCLVLAKSHLDYAKRQANNSKAKG